MVGNGALLYRRDLEEAGPRVEFASPSNAFPQAVSVMELAMHRFEREETTPPAEITPLYVRKSDAEINWARRARSA